MAVPVLTFFNNKGGVGKTSLAYHLAWMLSDLGYNVLACDLDPQANLTAAFLDDEQLESPLAMMVEGAQASANTIFECVKPLMQVGRTYNYPSLKRIIPPTWTTSFLPLLDIGLPIPSAI